MTVEAVEKIHVVPAELIKVRDTINLSLGNSIAAVSEFFGGKLAIDEPADNETVLIQQSTAHALILRAHTELELAGNMRIASPEQYTKAADDLQRIKGLGKDLEEKRKAMTGHIDAAKTSVQAMFRPANEFLSNAETAIKSAMIVFDREQERLRQIEAAKRAQKEAEERAALEAAQAVERAKAEAKEKELRDQAAAAAAAGDAIAAAKLEAKAASQQEIGEAKVETLAQKAAEAVAAPTSFAPVAVKGISKRTKFVAELNDLKALCAAVAAGTVPLAAVNADLAVLTKMANALSGELNYPGVTVREEIIIGSRSK